MERRTRARQSLSLIERIEAIGWDEVLRVPDLGECWEWRGGKHEKGYGLLHVRPRMVKVHRAMLEHRLGEDLGSRFALHRCDNPPCVNPAHLYPRDARQNIGDAIERGRFDPSATSRRAQRRRLAPEMEASVRLSLALGASKNAVARQHEIAWSTVDRIARESEIS